MPCSSVTEVRPVRRFIRRFTRRLLALSLIFLVLGLPGLGLPRADAVDGNSQKPVLCSVAVTGNIDIDKPAPSFQAPSLFLTSDSNCVELSKYQGQPVVINFWASWCFPCRKEFPLLKKAKSKYRKDKLVIIGMSYKDIPSDARAFVKDQKADWHFAQDPDQKIAAAYGVRAIPVTLFIDRDGVLASHKFGISSQKELNREIDRLVKR